MSPCTVIVREVAGEDVAQVRLAQNADVSRHSCRTEGLADGKTVISRGLANAKSDASRRRTPDLTQRTTRDDSCCFCAILAGASHERRSRDQERPGRDARRGACRRRGRRRRDDRGGGAGRDTAGGPAHARRARTVRHARTHRRPRPHGERGGRVDRGGARPEHAGRDRWSAPRRRHDLCPFRRPAARAAPAETSAAQFARATGGLASTTSCTRS